MVGEGATRTGGTRERGKRSQLQIFLLLNARRGGHASLRKGGSRPTTDSFRKGERGRGKENSALNGEERGPGEGDGPVSPVISEGGKEERKGF